MSFLSELLTKYNQIRVGGVVQPRRSALTIIGGTVTDDPANDSTNVTVGGSSQGGFTQTTLSFTQPAVNASVSVSVATTQGLRAGQSIAVGSGGYYINQSTVDATHLLLVNTGSAVNQSPAGTVTANELVSIAGQGAPLAAQARSNGQGNVLVAGTDTPYQHAPLFFANLSTLPPSGTRQVVHLDGYASVGDGGHGKFHWDNAYSTVADSLHVYVAGISTGAWVREIGADNVVLAAWFGAKGDNVADDTAALQAMLDYNNVYTQTSTNVSQYTCKLNKTQYQNPLTAITAPRTMYLTSSPLVINDTDILGPTPQNTTQVFVGEPGAASGLLSYAFQGPLLVCGNVGLAHPVYLLDPSGSGETVCQVGENTPCHVASGSNAFVLPASPTTFTLNVDSTTAFPPKGQISIIGTGANSEITYTGKTSTTFTGCQVANATYFTLSTGQTIYPYSYAAPQWNFSEYSTGHLGGVTNFTLEYFVNPCDSTAWANTNLPTGFVSSMFGCEGAVGTIASLSHVTFHMQQDNAFGVMRLFFAMTTVNGTYQVTTSTSTDHTPGANALSHVAISYDGAHLRMFVNGAQPDGTMTVAATGALDQRWYEAMTLNSGRNVNFPVMGGNGSVVCNPPGTLLGRIRFSLNARYTAPFTAPLPSAVTCDSNTRLYIDFTSGNIPSRPGLKAYTIARSGNSRYGTMTGYPNGYPIWLNTWTQSFPYTSGARVRDLFFVSAGRGIELQSSLSSEVGENCTFGACEQGIVFSQFSYNSGVGKHCSHVSSGTHGNANCHNAEFIFGPGAQFSYISKGWASLSGTSSWAVIHCNTDLTIETGLPVYYIQGVFCFTQNASCIHLNGVSVLDDQATGYLTAGILMAPFSDFGATLTWSGGYSSLENTVAPLLILGASGVSVSVHNTQFGGSPGYPLFSFQGDAATRHVPIIYSGPTFYPIAGLNLPTPPLVDPAFPGRVIVPQQEMAGTNVLNFGSDADMILSFNAFAYGRVRTTDTHPWLSAARNVLLPTALEGWTRTFINGTAKTLHYIAANGTWAAPVHTAITAVTYSSPFGLYTITATAHGLATGATVTIASVAFTGTATGPNGAGFVVTVIDANNFYFQTTPGGTFTYTSGGTATQTVTVGTLWAAKTPNDRSFLCTAITTGQTGASEPTWNTTIGVTTTDGGVTWTCHGAGVSATTGTRVTTLSDGTNWT